MSKTMTDVLGVREAAEREQWGAEQGNIAQGFPHHRQPLERIVRAA